MTAGSRGEVEPDFERKQEDAAAEQAVAIGGRVSSEPDSVDGGPDEASRPLVEAGGGEAE